MAAGDLDRTLRACRRARVAALDDAHRAQEVKKSAARVATARAAHTVPPRRRRGDAMLGERRAHNKFTLRRAQGQRHGGCLARRSQGARSPVAREATGTRSHASRPTWAAIGKLLKTTKEEDMSSDSPIASHHLLNFLFLRVQAWLRSNHPHSRLSSAMAPSASTHCRAG